MPTFDEVARDFKNNDIENIIRIFFENILSIQNRVVPNHNGTVSFCQFAKYASITSKIHRHLLDPNVMITIVDGKLDENKIEITEIKTLPSLTRSEINLCWKLVFNGKLVADFSSSILYTSYLSVYIKGPWIEIIKEENKIYLKDKQKSNTITLSVNDQVDENRFKI